MHLTPARVSSKKSESEKMNKTTTSLWIKRLRFIIIIAIVYFGNLELQSYLGRQALAQTGLETLEFEDALRKADKQDKFVLVDISAIYCGTCRKLDQEIFSDERVKQALSEQYVFSRIEYGSELGEKMMQKYPVKGFPTLLVLDHKGKLIRKLGLTFEPEMFIAQL